MNKWTWMAAMAVASGLSTAAWAEGPGRWGGRHGGGPEEGCGWAFRPPHEYPEVMAARAEMHDLARRAKAAEGEERERLEGELREKVRAETERVDRLQEERLDAIERAAQERVAAVRERLAEMREHRDEFVEREVERLLRDRFGDRGELPPPPPPRGEEMGAGRMPPPPCEGPGMGGKHGGPRHGHWKKGRGKGCHCGKPGGEKCPAADAPAPEEAPEKEGAE